MRVPLHIFQCSRKGFQLVQAQRTQFVAGCAMQRELDDSVAQNPGERLPLMLFHARRRPLAAISIIRPLHYTACFIWYICSISFFIRAAIKSRFSLPFTVSMPFSIEKGSARRQN